MSQDDYERGRADARLDENDDRHEENIRRFNEIEAKLDEIVSAVAVAKGGIRILFAVGSISATLGILAHTILGWLWGHLK